MASEQFVDFAQTTLSASIGSGDSSLTVTSASGFPSTAQFRLLIDSELLLVTNVSGTTWTVTRGIEGTTAAGHASGATVTAVLTAGALGGMSDATATTPSLRSLGTGAQQACAGNDSRLSDSRTPTGSAGGDLGGSYPNPSVAQVNGVAFPASPSTNTVPVCTSSNHVTWEAVPNAALQNSSLTVTAGSGLTGGGSVALGSSETIGVATNGITNSMLAQISANTIKGNNTGATANAADLTTTQVTAMLNTFGPSGSGHAQGAVPDPGSTAHSNFPFVLGDNGNWLAMKGQILASLLVTTDESTSSTSFVDLTTAESVSFTLDVATDLIVTYYANMYNATGTGGAQNGCYLDGSDQVGADNWDIGFPGSGVPVGAALATKIIGVAAGSHTIDIKHAVPSGQTIHWRQRLMTVTRA